MQNTSTLTRLAAAVVAAVCLGSLAACGGSDDNEGSGSEPTSSGAPSGRPPGGFDEETLQQVRECLDAAGIEDALPSGEPSDLPSDFPTDLPSDLPTDLPSDFPTDPPSDIPSGFPSDGQGGGPGGAMFNDPEVQDALVACGIELPTPGQ